MYFPDYTAKVEAKREEANSLIAFDELASTFVILGDKQWIIGCSYVIKVDIIHLEIITAETYGIA